MQNIFKLSRKFVLLTAMLIGLSFVAFTDFGSTATGAAPCCSYCDSIEAQCEAMPPGPDQDRCYQRAFNCYSWCNFGC